MEPAAAHCLPSLNRPASAFEWLRNSNIVFVDIRNAGELADMGVSKVAHIAGGYYGAWREANGPTARAD